MKCTRCRGLMVRDHFYDLLDGSGPHRIMSLRCVSCGNVLDPMILKNRRARQACLTPI